LTRFAPSPATLFHLAAAALIGLPSAAQVTFNGSEAPVLTLHSRGTLTLTVANRGDAAPRHWNWAPPPDLTRQGARLEIIGPDQAAFHAPPTLEEHAYVFRVTSADAAGIVTPSGVVTTPLAWWHPRELAGLDKERTKDMTSVAGQPHPVAPNLAIYGRDLYLFDFDLGEGLFAFNLDSKRFVTVIPGALDLFIHTRFGPIRHLAPGTPVAASALLGTIQHRGPLVITPEGTGILAMGAGLMEVDLPREGSVTTRGAAAPAAPGGH